MSICKICFKEIKITSPSEILNNFSLCSDCYFSLKPGLRKIKLNTEKGYCLYSYEESMKSLIYQFKGCGDYELKDVFLSRYKNLLRLLFKKYTLVPAPSYEAHNKERGFNHIIEIFSVLALPICDCLIKNKDIKQSDLKKTEREKIGNYLSIKEGTDLKNKKVLFVDDILTTGSTAKACINLIKGAGAKKVRFLVLAHPPFPEKSIFNRIKEKIFKNFSSS